MPTHLVWFRADLRLHDNIALAAACRSEHARVLALFIATPDSGSSMIWPPDKPLISVRI